MDITTLFFIFIAIIFGFLIGKYITGKIKWSDKRKLLEEKWRNEFLEIQKDNELKFEKMDSNWKLKFGQMDNDWKLKFEKMDETWKLKYSTELSEIKDLIKGAEKYMRQDAVKRSRRTLLGKLWEQVSPYIPKFPFQPADMKFLGAPIDFVIFDGMGEKDIKQVIFLEVKSGKSTLNTQERKLKEVIESGKVKWKMFNIENPEEIKLDLTTEEDIDDGIDPHMVYGHIDNKIQEVKEKTPDGKIQEVEKTLDEDDAWECEHCGKEFDTEEECDEHEEECDSADTKKTTNSCHTCGKEFGSFSSKHKIGNKTVCLECAARHGRTGSLKIEKNERHDNVPEPVNEINRHDIGVVHEKDPTSELMRKIKMQKESDLLRQKR